MSKLNNKKDGTGQSFNFFTFDSRKVSKGSIISTKIQYLLSILRDRFKITRKKLLLVFSSVPLVCAFAYMMVLVAQQNGLLGSTNLSSAVGVIQPYDSAYLVSGSTISMTVPYDTSSMTVNLTISNRSVWTLYQDDKYTSVITDKTVTLNEGANLFYVKVISGNKKFTKYYTLSILRETTPGDCDLPDTNPGDSDTTPDIPPADDNTASNSCDVTAVNMPSGALSGSTITSTVPNSTTSLTVNITVSDGATWKLYSDSQYTNDISKTVNLSLGLNTYYIKVTSESSNYSNTYTVRITRQGAAEYYVSTTGSDSNPGTISSPWKTLQKAANTVGAGATVYVRGGTYNQRTIMQNSGTAGNPITFMAYSGETVTLDGTGLYWYSDYGGLFDTNRKSYITVDGFKIINSPGFGVGMPWNTAETPRYSNIVVKNCTFNNTNNSAVFYEHGDNITVDHNVIANASIGLSQEVVSMEDVNGYVISNNTINTSQKEGIDVKRGSSNGKVFGNRISNTKICIYIDSFDRYETNVEVYNNFTQGCEVGIAVASEHNGTLENVKIHHNTAYNNQWGIWVTDWDDGSTYTHTLRNIYIYNNTMYKNSENQLAIGNTPWAYNIVIANNLFGYGTPGSSSASVYVMPGNTVTSEYHFDHNYYNVAGSSTPKGTNYLIGTGSAESWFVNAPALDFRLQSSAPVINAGRDYWTGATVNIGAF